MSNVINDSRSSPSLESMHMLAYANSSHRLQHEVRKQPKIRSLTGRRRSRLFAPGRPDTDPQTSRPDAWGLECN